jgi:hypothetical protein
MSVKICEHCEREYQRSGRPEQRFCSQECFRASRYKDRPTSRRCENCPTIFELGCRQRRKRFCSPRCVALARERLKRITRPPSPPRARRKPGRIEWSIGGMHRSRGMAPTPRSPWYELLRRVGFSRTGRRRE